MSYPLFVLIIVANGLLSFVDTFPTAKECRAAELAVVQEIPGPVAASCWSVNEDRVLELWSESKK